MPDTSVYEARAISKSYGSVTALEDVDFQVGEGEIVGLVGDNGAGKSTLVKVLSGIHQPDGGSLFLDGNPRSWRSPHDALEAGIETL
jgi:simple sugar transport system ATP-binding protein